ncbi:hypothetical protein CA850_13580 [Micromonospora echinospora]|uniref:Uncharacterized protein n=1 Tax=Micromonospora echinospora TaxID=1877 RepID=A0A1C4ZEH0_MICEC|nr:hypothetical protein [Micromonospora echinospora]OZV80393.1 hypothetical protein CA850_13580 [Micromonospora echinospora]SCF31358.1 hypothetical protein GA0070618_5141 [Micromonospora echinospora]
MKSHFTRWLPAIAKTSNRRTALTLAGVVALGGLALAPAAYPGPLTGGPHPDAVAAIDLATGKNRAPESTDAVTPTETVRADAAEPDEPSQKPDVDRLVPHGVQGAQSRITLDDAQLANARAIVETAKETGVGERGAVIGVATALQESKLYNLGHLGAVNDHDSQGLFQQRPSTGWGSPEQITDPEYASTAFFEALKDVRGWQEAPLTVAAQTVQVSAYPFAYAQWEEQAAEVVQRVW